MSRPRKKHQMTVYLDPDISKAIGELAVRRRQSNSLVVETALAAFLSPDEVGNDSAVGRRLEKLDRRVAHLERDVGINVETLALFIRFWLLTSPALPEPAAAAARAQAGERYDVFLETLGRRLNRGPRLHQEISGNTDGAI